jgi:2-keto-3-deoxy-L-rhamnonate aldolase RhmA
MTRTNETLTKVANGETTYGAWVSSMSPRAAEAFGAHGLDWAVVDMEHSPITAEGVENVVRGIETAGITPIVRVPEIDYGLKGTFKRVLDSGAMGVIVPRIEHASEAERVVEAALYPPEGDRGVVGGSRVNGYGTGFDDYVERANDEVFVCVQIETVTGAENAEEILSVDGVNGVFIGENDLSTTHGAAGQKGRDAVQADVDHIYESATANGVATGIVAPTQEKIAERVDDGYDLISIGSDLYFVGHAIGELLPE